MKQSWNPTAKFVVFITSNYTHFESTIVSKVILNELWAYGVTQATALFIQPNEQASKDIERNTSHWAQGTHLEMHTWYPYENSDRCDPVDGTVPVQVFTARNTSDVRKSGLYKTYFERNLHQCAIRMHAHVIHPLVNLPKCVCYKDYDCHSVFENGLENELSRISAYSLNMSLHIADLREEVHRKGTHYIYIGEGGTIRFIRSRGMILHEVISLYGLRGTGRVL
jgi:hypothetical protein